MNIKYIAFTAIAVVMYSAAVAAHSYNSGRQSVENALKDRIESIELRAKASEALLVQERVRIASLRKELADAAKNDSNANSVCLSPNSVQRINSVR
jgi:hypothetical protein